QLTAVQRLQLLINELEEYEASKPSDKPTLDQYIPWEEIERKRRLRNWLLQVQHEALQEGDLPPSPNLSLFNGDEGITMEQLDSMFSSFHSYMVFIPPPKELQTPTSNTIAQAGDKPTTLVYQRRPPGSSSRHPKKGRGRHQKAASSTTKHPDRIILFHGEEAKPLPEPQIRADSYIFDPSDEEGGLPDKASQSEDKNSSPFAPSNEPDNVPPLPNEKLLAPISQKKPVKSKELSGSSSREFSHLDQIRSEADDKILQQLQSLPPLCLLSFGRSGPARVVSISSTEASLFGIFNFISGILSLTRYCLAKLAFQPSNTLFSCGHPQFSRLPTLAHLSNLEIIGFSIALQSFKSLGPGRLNLTGVHPVPNIGDKIHPTLLLDSHAKGRSGMLLQRLSNNFNGRRVCGVCQCRYSTNKEFPAAIISKMWGWLRLCRPSYTMLRGSTNLQGRRAAFVRIRHSVCPGKEISSKKKLLARQSWRVNCGYNFSIQVPYQVMKTRSKAQRMHGTSSFGFGFGAHPVGGIC
ncbi:hypothetical protein Taro_056166, partial [Colocasia esculenta]|nr:hypothetical protein [Colocasia esculenta]